jgi:LemA protein
LGKYRGEFIMSAAVILLIAAGVVIVGLIAIYNSLVTLRNQVANAWKQIDVQLKRRHDLIPNLVNTVKDYMQYEQETLNGVIEARGKALGANNTHDAIAAENGLTQAVGKLFALMENYPDLKAQKSVADLTEELRSTENKIAFARQHYNDSVMSMNNKVQTFPSNLVANMFSFKQEEYFAVPEAEKEVVKVSLRD